MRPDFKILIWWTFKVKKEFHVVPTVNRLYNFCDVVVSEQHRLLFYNKTDSLGL